MEGTAALFALRVKERLDGTAAAGTIGLLPRVV